MFHLDEYAGRYRHIRLERSEGVLEMTLHLDGGPLLWNEHVHRELPEAFQMIAQDSANHVVILTGTGDTFCAGMQPGACQFDGSVPPVALDKVYREGRGLLTNQLAVPVPMIAAVNGPALAHCQLALLCDIVIVSETAIFADKHLEYGIVPGNGIHVAFPMAFGMNRGRYLLLTGQEVTARQAQEWGAVAEVLPADRVIGRARELAGRLACQPILALRHTRELLERDIQRQLHDMLSLGLALEGFASGYGAWLSPGSAS